jgi:hypothetical protein
VGREKELMPSFDSQWVNETWWQEGKVKGDLVPLYEDTLEKEMRMDDEKKNNKHVSTKREWDGDAFILLTAQSPASKTGEKITQQQHGKKRCIGQEMRSMFWLLTWIATHPNMRTGRSAFTIDRKKKK